MPWCQDGAPALCHRSVMRRRGELSGSFLGRCCACIGLPIRALLPRGCSNIPGHLRLRWLFLKTPGLIPGRVRPPPPRAPLPARVSALGFPRSAGAGSGLPGRLGARRLGGSRDALARAGAWTASIWLLREDTRAWGELGAGWELGKRCVHAGGFVEVRRASFPGCPKLFTQGEEVCWEGTRQLPASSSSPKSRTRPFLLPWSFGG